MAQGAPSQERWLAGLERRIASAIAMARGNYFSRVWSVFRLEMLASPRILRLVVATAGLMRRL